MPDTDSPARPATDRTPTAWRQLALSVPIYFACLLMAGLLWPRPVWMAVLGALLSVAVLGRGSTRDDRLYYAVPFVLGPSGEAVAVHLGAWSYANTPLIPLWLPFLWGLAGVFMRRATVALGRLLGPEEERPAPR